MLSFDLQIGPKSEVDDYEGISIEDVPIIFLPAIQLYPQKGVF